MAVALSRRRLAAGSPRRQARGREGERGWVGNFLATLFLMACLVSLALAHVWVRLQVVRLGYVLSTTSKLQGQLEQENRELKLELATLTSPDRLEALARSRLGLREPEKGQVVIFP